MTYKLRLNKSQLFACSEREYVVFIDGRGTTVGFIGSGVTSYAAWCDARKNLSLLLKQAGDECSAERMAELMEAME